MKALIGRILLCGLASIFAATAAAAQVDKGGGTGPLPYTMMLAGDKVLAVDQGDRLWQRDAAEGAVWAPVRLTPDLPDFHPLTLACATEPYRVCLFTVSDGHAVHKVLYWPQTGKSAAVHMPANARYLAFHDQDSLYYALPAAAGDDELHLYNFTTGSDRVLDHVSPTEKVISLNVDGHAQEFIDDHKTQPLSVRPIGAHPATPVAQFPWRDGVAAGLQGIFIGEYWHIDNPAIAGARAELRLTFTQPKVSGGPLTQKVTLITGGATDGPSLPIFILGAVDANGDFVAETTGPAGRYIGYACSNGPQDKAFIPLMQIPEGASASITADTAADGFVVDSYSPTRSDQFKLFNLTAADTSAAGRSCRGTRVSVTDLGIPSEDVSDQLSVSMQTAVSKDGTKVPYMVVAPKGDITHVIVDVYGGFGLPRSYDYIGRDGAAQLAAGHTAVVYATVRGDGDLGYAYAMASRAPNRMKAVEDVAAVGAAVKTLFPGLTAKPTVRGGSAGGWLAVKTVLTYPDLFAGAIGREGAYITDRTATPVQFFAPGDSLMNDVAAAPSGCNGSRFRLLHARDDTTVPYADATAFAKALQAKGCSVTLESFDGGGHAIRPAALSHEDGARRLKGDMTAF